MDLLASQKVVEWEPLPVDLQDQIWQRLEFKDLFRFKIPLAACKELTESRAFLKSSWDGRVELMTARLEEERIRSDGAAKLPEGIFAAVDFYTKDKQWQLAGFDLRSRTWRTLQPFSQIRTDHADAPRPFSFLVPAADAYTELDTGLEEAVAVSAAALVSLVYLKEALIALSRGHIDRGGIKTYSSGSLEFRPTYVSIILFLASYVWLKFRAAPSSRGYRRPKKDKLSGTTKFAARLEVRYKPPRSSGNHNHIHLCMCDTVEEARIYWKIADRYYNKRNDGQLDLGDGSHFLIPSTPVELEEGLSVSEKRKWVKGKVMEIYKDFLKAKYARSQSSIGDDAIVHSNEQRLTLSGGPSTNSDHGFGTNEMETMFLPAIPRDGADLGAGFSVDDLLNIPQPDILPQQHFQDNQAQDLASAAAPMFDDLNPSETAPVATPLASGSEGPPNVVHNSHASDSAIVNHVLTPQQGSDAMAVHPDMVAESVTNFCLRNSIAGLLVILAHQIQKRDGKIEEQEKRIGFLMQELQERDGQLGLLQQQIQEQHQYILKQFMEQINS